MRPEVLTRQKRPDSMKTGDKPSPLTKCPRRLAWPRTSPFHGGNTGSNPVGDAKSFQELTGNGHFWRRHKKAHAIVDEERQQLQQIEESNRFPAEITWSSKLQRDCPSAVLTAVSQVSPIKVYFPIKEQADKPPGNHLGLRPRSPMDYLRRLVRLARHPLAGRNNAISVRLVRHN